MFALCILFVTFVRIVRKELLTELTNNRLILTLSFSRAIVNMVSTHALPFLIFLVPHLIQVVHFLDVLISG